MAEKKMYYYFGVKDPEADNGYQVFYDLSTIGRTGHVPNELMATSREKLMVHLDMAREKARDVEQSLYIVKVEVTAEEIPNE